MLLTWTACLLVRALAFTPQSVRLTSADLPVVLAPELALLTIASAEASFQCSDSTQSYGATLWLRSSTATQSPMPIFGVQTDSGKSALAVEKEGSTYAVTLTNGSGSVRADGVIAGNIGVWDFIGTYVCEGYLILCSGQWRGTVSCKNSAIGNVQSFPPEGTKVMIGGGFSGQLLDLRVFFGGCLGSAQFTQLLVDYPCASQCAEKCTGPGLLMCSDFLSLSNSFPPLSVVEEKHIGGAEVEADGRRAVGSGLGVMGWVKAKGTVPSEDVNVIGVKSLGVEQLQVGLSASHIFGEFAGQIRLESPNADLSQYRLVSASACGGTLTLCHGTKDAPNPVCTSTPLASTPSFTTENSEFVLGNGNVALSLTAIRVYPNVCLNSTVVAGVISSPFPVCIQFCKACSTPDICEICQDGFYLSGDGLCLQCSCLCQLCSGPGTDRCLACAVGSYPFGTGSCKACPGLCADCTQDDPKTCTVCVENAVQAQTPGECICTTGYFFDVTYNRCAKCTLGCVACSSLLSCTKCADAYQNISGMCLQNCPVGMEFLGASCIVSKQPLAFNLQLTRIINNNIERVTGWESFAGSAEIYEPLKDSMDPFAHYHEGMFFNHSMIRLPPHLKNPGNVLLPATHTVEVWCRPVGLQDSALFFKNFRDILILSFSINTIRLTSSVHFTGWDDKAVPTLKQVTAAGLIVKSWMNLGYTIDTLVKEGSYSTAVSLFQNGRMIGTAVFQNTRFCDLLGEGADVSFTIGCQSANPGFSQFFEGHIAEVNIYNANYLYMDPPACSCPFCSSQGLCLNDCNWLYYLSGSDTCVKCLDTCEKGCVRGGDCILNLFPACPSYTDFDSCDCGPNQTLDVDTGTCVCVAGYWSDGSKCCHSSCTSCSSSGPAFCTSCTAGTVLTASAPATCGCDGSQYFDDLALVCKSCHQSCATCTADSPFACLTCASGFLDTGFGFCEKYCPTGFTSGPSQCVAPGNPAVLGVSFAGITNTPLDQMSGFKLFSGSKKSVYPNSDPSDPVPVYRGGLSFSGNKQYLRLPPNDEDSRAVTLASSHSVEIWVRATGQAATILMKSFQGAIFDDYEAVKISQNLNVVVMLKVSLSVATKRTGGDASYLVQASGPLIPLAQWVRIGYKVKHVDKDLSLKIFVDFAQKETLFPGVLFRDYEGLPVSFTLGCDTALSNCYKGLIAEIQIVQGALPSPATSQCGCPVCSSLGMCLSGCAFMEYWADGKCQQCGSTCTFGCITNISCSLNLDILCAFFSQFTSCDTCSDGAELDLTGVCHCSARKWLVSGRCCHETCVNCLNADERGCTACRGDTVMAGVSFPTACACPPRSFLSAALKCTSCDDSCKSCTSVSRFSCIDCLSGSKVDNLYCSSKPPTGYALSQASGYRLAQAAAILKMQFANLTNFPVDSVFGFKAFCGSSAAYYPTLDPNDPMAVFQAGYYFDGKQSYIKLPPNAADPRSLLLAPSHSFDLWVRFTQLSGCLLSKSTSLTTLFSLCISGSNLIVSISLYEYIGADDTVPVKQVPLSLNGGSLATNVWTRVGYSLANDGQNSILTIYINGAAVATQKFSGYVFVDSDGSFSLGRSELPAAYLNGYLAELTVSNAAIAPQAVSSCGCPVCSSLGQCLSPCGLTEYQTQTGCNACSSDCTTGCRGPSNCKLNLDPLCSDIADFLVCGTCTLGAYLTDSGVCKCKVVSSNGSCCYPMCLNCLDTGKASCTSCPANSLLLSGPPGECVCTQGSYLSNSLECRSCHSSCQSCTGPSAFQCTSCTLGFFLIASLYCAAECPTGFSVLDSVCVSPGNALLFSVNFPGIAGMLADKIAGYNVTLGSSPAFFPNRDVNDPMVAYQGGLAFNGSNQYANLPPNAFDSRRITLAPSHEVVLWVRTPTGSHGCFLSKSTGEDLLLSLCFQEPRLLLRLSLYNFTAAAFSVQTVTGTMDVPQSSWTMVGFRVETTLAGSGTAQATVSLRVDSTLQATVFPLSAFADLGGATQAFVLGCEATGLVNCLSGQVAEVMVFAGKGQVKPGSCGCATCSTLGMCLGPCLFREFWAEGCQPCGAACLDGCVRSSSCSLSLDPLCGTYSDFSVCAACSPLSSFDSTQKCICVDQSTLVSGKCACIAGSFKSGNQCVVCLNYLAPEDVEAKLDASFVKIVLSFQKSLEIERVKTCADLFAATTLAKMGTNPACSWTSDQSAVVLLGIGMTLSSEPITLQSKNIIARQGECNSNLVNLEPILQFAVVWPKPEAIIAAPSVYSTSCATTVLRLSGAATKNTKGQTAEYKWLLTLLPSGTKLNQYSAYSPDLVEVIIESKLLMGKTLQVQLFVRTPNGGEASTNSTISLSSKTILDISIDRGESLSIQSSQPTVLTAITGQSCSVDLSSVGYVWTADQQPAGMKFPISSRTLTIPGKTLPPGSKYVFTVTGSYQSLTGSAKVAVTATASPLSVLFDRSSGDQSNDSDLVIDATGSKDPNSDVSVLAFLWSCSDACLNAAKQTLTFNATAAVLRVPKSDLMKDAVYNFSLTVSVGQLSGSSQIVIKVVGAVGAQLKIPWSKQRIQAKARVSIIPELNVTDLVGFLWTQTSGSPLTFSTPPNVAWLEIRGQDLIQGADYGLQLTVTTKLGSMSQNLIIEVNSNPTSGRCVVTPTTGGAISTAFRMSCAGWEDPDNTDYPLAVNFAVMVNSRARLLSSPSAFGEFTCLLFPGNLELIGSVCDSLQGCTTVSMTVTVTVPATITDLSVIKSNFQTEAVAEKTAATVAAYALTVGPQIDSQFFQLLLQYTKSLSSPSAASNGALGLLLTATLSLSTLTSYMNSLTVTDLGATILAMIAVLVDPIDALNSELVKIAFAAVPLVDTKVMKAVSDYLAKLTLAVGTDSLPGAEPVIVQSGNTTILSKSVVVDSSASLNLKSANMSLSFPPSFLSDMNIPTNSAADLRVNVYLPPKEPAPVITCSLVIGGVVRDGNIQMSTATPVSVANLTAPVNITSNINNYDPNLKYSAYYLNETTEKWTSDGVVLDSISAQGGVMMVSHFSTFKIAVRETLNVSLVDWSAFESNFTIYCGDTSYLPILVDELLLIIWVVLAALVAISNSKHNNELSEDPFSTAKSNDGLPIELQIFQETKAMTDMPAIWSRTLRIQEGEPQSSTTMELLSRHYLLGLILPKFRRLRNAALFACVSHCELLVLGLFFMADQDTGIDQGFIKAVDSFTLEDYLRCLYAFLIAQGVSLCLGVISKCLKRNVLLVLVLTLLSIAMNGGALYIAFLICPEPSAKWVAGFLVILGADIAIGEIVVAFIVMVSSRPFKKGK